MIIMKWSAHGCLFNKYVSLAALLPAAVFLMSSCDRSNPAIDTLHRTADSLMATRPDSALLLLQAPGRSSVSSAHEADVSHELPAMSRRQRMRHELLCAKAMNKAYVTFTTDTVMKEVARWYDSHGTPAEKMEAHYLLGCAYRDLGDAPQALRCYQEAVELADTTGWGAEAASPVVADKCRLMISICGQMAELYDAQNLPADEIAAMKDIQHYALIMHDSLMYIRTHELMTKPYYKLGDTAKVIQTVWEAHRLYTEAGESQKAAGAFATLAHIMLKRGQTGEAARLLREYETTTGLFDSLGNIARGHEMYYYIKGCCHLAAGKTDSAETFFRKLLPSIHTADAYRGLMDVWQRRHHPDSTAKYSRLFEAATDSVNNRRRTETVHQMAALYDYQRLQRKADKEARAAADARKRADMAMALIVLTMVAAAAVFAYYRKGKQRQLDKMGEQCLVVGSLLARARAELRDEREAAEAGMRNHHYQQEEMQEKLREKTAEVSELEDRLQQLEGQYRSATQPPALAGRKNSEAVKTIRRRAEWKHGAATPTADEWIRLANQFRLDFPQYYATMAKGKRLATKEMRTCMLLMLDFKEGEIAGLLDVKPQRVTNIKKRVNMKLFGDDSAATLTKNIEKAMLNA